MRKVAVFVDVQNLQEVFEKQGAEVRYDRIKSYLLNKYKMKNVEFVKFVAFVPSKKDDDKRTKLIDAISLMGYRIVTKPAKVRPDGSIKANMDIEITIEAISMVGRIDELVLVSGDSDYEPLIDYLSKCGIKVVILGPGRGPTAVEIIRAADEFENLTEIEGTIVK